MKTFRIAMIAAVSMVALGATGASAAECTTKAAKATAGSDKDAKWFAMETMVQAVSWGLWPGFLANGKVEGYKVSGEKYKCAPDGGQVTCHGVATFCKS
jgi:hypothetical protein